MGNGNPSSHEADKASNQRAVFNGLAEVIVQSTSQPGSIVLTATSSGPIHQRHHYPSSLLPPPAAPTGVSAVGGNTQVTVTWDLVPGATTYNLWRATTSGGPYTLIAGNIGGVNLGCIDTNVTNLTRYYYVVTANGANGNGTSTNSFGSQRHAISHGHRPDGNRRQRPDFIELERFAGCQLQCETFHRDRGSLRHYRLVHRHQ